MGKQLSAIRTICRQMLRDEFSAEVTLDFPDDEIDLHIADCLVEISERSPYELKETLKTTASSRELDITSIVDFIGLDPEREIEYPVGRDPPEYHNASIFGKTLTMEISALPSANQDVYLFCHKNHQLTEDSSTLSPQIERLLVLGVTARLAIAKARSRISKINIAGRRAPSDMHAWGVSQLALYRDGLKGLAKPKTYVEYSKG